MSVSINSCPRKLLHRIELSLCTKITILHPVNGWWWYGEVSLCNFLLLWTVTISHHYRLILHDVRMRWWYGKDTHCDVMFINLVVRSWLGQFRNGRNMYLISYVKFANTIVLCLCLWIIVTLRFLDQYVTYCYFILRPAALGQCWDTIQFRNCYRVLYTLKY